MRRVVTLLLALASLGFTLAAWSADWPAFRGPNADGISPDKGINKDWAQKPPAELWRVTMTDNGCSGPAVADGKVFIVDFRNNTDVVRALDLNTGADVWQYSYPDMTNDNYGHARSTPAYANGKLYVQSRSGQLLCLDAKAGTLVWKCTLTAGFGGRKPSWDYSMSPLVDGNKVIVCPGGPNAAVAALDVNTGAMLWKGGGSDAPGYATPVAASIDNIRQYVVFTAGGVIGVNAANGQLLWSFPWKTSYDVNAATPLVISPYVFITSGYNTGGTLLQIANHAPAQLWVNKVYQAHFNTPIYYNGYFYGITDPGTLMCLNPKMGEATWRQPGFEKGGVVGVDGVLIAQSGSNGDLTMVELTPDRCNVLGRLRGLGGRSWTAPIVANSRLFVRNLSTLACYDLR